MILNKPQRKNSIGLSPMNEEATKLEQVTPSVGPETGDPEKLAHPRGREFE
jgi:hypothetical protein